MNGTPNCDLHGTQMRQSDRNPSQHYCTQKIGTGPKDYCTRRHGPNGYYSKGQTPPSVPQTHLPAGYTPQQAAYQPPVSPMTPPWQPPPPLPQVPMPAPMPQLPPLPAPGPTSLIQPIAQELRLRAGIAAADAAAHRYAGTAVTEREVVSLAQRLFLGLLEPALAGLPVPTPTDPIGRLGPDDDIPF